MLTAVIAQHLMASEIHHMEDQLATLRTPVGEAEATLTEAEAALKSVQTAAIDSDPAARLNRYRRTAGAV